MLKKIINFLFAKYHRRLFEYNYYKAIEIKRYAEGRKWDTDVKEEAIELNILADNIRGYYSKARCNLNLSRFYSGELKRLREGELSQDDLQRIFE